MCLLGQLETQEEKETRESREAQELYSAIQALKDGNPDIAKRWESSVFVYLMLWGEFFYSFNGLFLLICTYFITIEASSPKMNPYKL